MTNRGELPAEPVLRESRIVESVSTGITNNTNVDESNNSLAGIDVEKERTNGSNISFIRLDFLDAQEYYWVE